MKAKMWELFEALFEMTDEHETAPPWALALKLGEEVGELQEVVLKNHGFLRHKEIKEDDWHEAADVINVLIGYFSQAYPDLSPHEKTEKLYAAIADKGDKYARVIGVKND